MGAAETRRDLSLDDEAARSRRHRTIRAVIPEPTEAAHRWAAPHAMLDAALRQAVLWRLIPFDPTDAVKLPAATPDERPVWTADQTARFLAETGDEPHHTLWRFLIDS